METRDPPPGTTPAVVKARRSNNMFMKRTEKGKERKGRVGERANGRRFWLRCWPLPLHTGRWRRRQPEREDGEPFWELASPVAPSDAESYPFELRVPPFHLSLYLYTISASIHVSSKNGSVRSPPPLCHRPTRHLRVQPNNSQWRYVLLTHHSWRAITSCLAAQVVSLL
jgi:hypothetical protein